MAKTYTLKNTGPQRRVIMRSTPQLDADGKTIGFDNQPAVIIDPGEEITVELSADQADFIARRQANGHFIHIRPA
jgi:hypothetical protein